MRQIHLHPDAVPSTILGYGTTSLFGEPTAKERLALLEIAFEAGIRHFDTAPYYGYGEAERILGNFIAGKREQLTITTKYGIQPSKIVKIPLVNMMARRVLRLFPGIRNVLSRKANELSKKGAFTADEARRSLDQSLTALKTDHIDLFLLHEPTYEDAASPEMLAFLAEEMKRGRIRAFGCGGDFQAIQRIATAKLATASWLQFEDNVLSRRIEGLRATGARCITYRTFQRALTFLKGWLEAAPGRYTEWEHQLQADLKGEGVLSGLLQAASHFRNPDGIVLFSSHRPDRIRAAARIASEDQFTREQLQKFCQLTENMRLEA